MALRPLSPSEADAARRETCKSCDRPFRMIGAAAFDVCESCWQRFCSLIEREGTIYLSRLRSSTGNRLQCRWCNTRFEESEAIRHFRSGHAILIRATITLEGSRKLRAFLEG